MGGVTVNSHGKTMLAMVIPNSGRNEYCVYVGGGVRGGGGREREREIK
jgi:hypothetical protein